MEFDIGFVSNLGNAIISGEQAINGAYDSAWDDDVHESLHEFVSFFEREAKSIYDLFNSYPEIVSPLKAVDSKKLKEQCDNLMSSIEGL